MRTSHAYSSVTQRRGRRGRVSTDTMILVAVFTVAAHGLVLGGIEAGVIQVQGGLSTAGRAAARTPATAVAEADEPLDPSCDGDAMLAAAARVLTCATPLATDPGRCLDDVQRRYQLEVLACHVTQVDLPVEVALLDPASIAKIPPIDAEELREPLTPEEEQRAQQMLAQLQQEQQPPPPSPPQPAPSRPPLDNQVIENAKPDHEEPPPDDTRFVSDYDRKVDKQTVAHGTPQEDLIAKPKAPELEKKPQAREANTPEPPPDELPPGTHADAPPEPGKLSMRAPGAPQPDDTPQEVKVAGDRGGSDAPAGDGTARRRGDGDVSQDERKQVETKQGQGGAGGGAPRAPNLRPTDEILERVAGGGSVDHVEDVDEGDENAFNSKRWVFASFFNRVKRQVAQNWDPAGVWRREDPDGSVYGFKSRETHVKVSLDSRGQLAKIVVVGASGVQALDDEAIRAFRASGPFPNPPAQLINSDGRISFTFGFFFEIGERRSTWKIYRSQ